MTNVKTIWMMVVVLCLVGTPAVSMVHFRDGQIHDIDYLIDEDVYVDYEAPEMQTAVNMLDGGIIWGDMKAWGKSLINIFSGSVIDESFLAYDNTRINITGGSIFFGLSIQNNSQAHISGGYMRTMAAGGMSQVNISGEGWIDWLIASDSSQVEMSGGHIDESATVGEMSRMDISDGSIKYSLRAYGSSQVDITGGSIGYDLFADGSKYVSLRGGSVNHWLLADSGGILTIHGWDFAVDGQPFDYGELTSVLGGPWHGEPFRHLTGTLASGELINNDFRIGNDARIVLVPEPATIVLFALGALALRRRKCS